VDANGRRQIAAGTDIDPTSLAPSGARFHWLQGGEARTATLK